MNTVKCKFLKLHQIRENIFRFVMFLNKTHRSALRTPDQRAPVTGGMKRNEPVGGDAYGIPLKASTGSKCRPSKCTMTPDTDPYLVWTTRDDNCTVSAPMPPKLLFLLLLLLLLLLLAAAFDVLPLSPLLLLITLFILLVPLLLLPLLNAVEISRRNISIIIMNVFAGIFIRDTHTSTTKETTRYRFPVCTSTCF